MHLFAGSERLLQSDNIESRGHDFAMGGVGGYGDHQCEQRAAGPSEDGSNAALKCASVCDLFVCQKEFKAELFILL